MSPLSVLHVGEPGPALAQLPLRITATTSDEAPRAVVNHRFDAVVIDLRDAQPATFDAVAEIHALVPAVPIVVACPSAADGRAVDALRQGADDVLLDDDDCLAVLTHVVRTAGLRVRLDGAAAADRDHDGLTGTAAAGVLDDRLRHAMARAARTKEPLALVDLDVDGLADVNRRLGHEAGDEVLRMVGERLSGAVREVDTVCRPGGDEFLVLLEQVGSRADARRVVSRLASAVREPLDVGGRRLAPTFGAGVAVWPDHAAGVDQLRAAAREALRYAKRTGPDEIAFAPSLPREDRRTRRVEPTA